MTDSVQRVTIVGAGISGLACAYRLKQLGIAASLLESSDQVGGVIDTAESDGFLFESGPQSFQGTEPLLKLIRELGLHSQLQTSDPRAPRFVVRGGRLRKLPMSPPALMASSLLSLRSRWKVASEPLRRTRPPDDDESIGNFVRRKFGSEILEYLVAPFVSGVYAGDPETLSLRSAFPALEQWEREHGSVVRGAIKSRSDGEGVRPPLCSFRGGVATLPRAISANLGTTVQRGHTVTAVRRSSLEGAPRFDLKITESGRQAAISASAVVIATPAYTAATLMRTISPALATSLSAIPYAPVAVVASAYKRTQVADPLYGFGFLVPRKEKIRTLGTVWNSSLFPGRGPDGTVTMTSFIGGATDLEIINYAENEIAQIVQQDNAALLQITGPPVASKIWKYSRAIPQYNLRHGHIVSTIRAEGRGQAGLFFAGNYLEGPAIGKCIDNGFRTAEAVTAYLNRL